MDPDIEDGDDDDGEVEGVARPYPRVTSTARTPMSVSSVTKLRSSCSDEDEALWQGMTSLNPYDVEETHRPYKHGMGEGNGDNHEACREEEEDVVQGCGEEEEDVDDDPAFLENGGFDSPSAPQPTQGPRPMFVLVPMQTMYPLTFGSPAQTQCSALNTPRARQKTPIARYSTQQQ